MTTKRKKKENLCQQLLSWLESNLAQMVLGCTSTKNVQIILIHQKCGLQKVQLGFPVH